MEDFVPNFVMAMKWMLTLPFQLFRAIFTPMFVIAVVTMIAYAVIYQLVLRRWDDWIYNSFLQHSQETLSIGIGGSWVSQNHSERLQISGAMPYQIMLVVRWLVGILIHIVVLAAWFALLMATSSFNINFTSGMVMFETMTFNLVSISRNRSTWRKQIQGTRAPCDS